eukprot:scpid10482/ scgid25690/ 
MANASTDSIVLMCSHDAPNITYPFYTWRRQDGTPLDERRHQVMGHDGEILRIQTPEPSDSGEYVCEVKAPDVMFYSGTAQVQFVGPARTTMPPTATTQPAIVTTTADIPDTTSMVVTTQAPTTPTEVVTTEQLPTTVYQEFNAVVSPSRVVVNASVPALVLTCAHDKPNVTLALYKWRRADGQLPTQRVMISDQFGDMLTIFRPESSDAGVYTCEVSDPDGNILPGSATVVYEGPPRTMPTTVPIMTTAPASVITSEKDEKPLVEVNTTTTTPGRSQVLVNIPELNETMKDIGPVVVEYRPSGEVDWVRAPVPTGSSQIVLPELLVAGTYDIRVVVEPMDTTVDDVVVEPEQEFELDGPGLSWPSTPVVCQSEDSATISAPLDAANYTVDYRIVDRASGELSEKIKLSSIALSDPTFTIPGLSNASAVVVVASTGDGLATEPLRVPLPGDILWDTDAVSAETVSPTAVHITLPAQTAASRRLVYRAQLMNQLWSAWRAGPRLTNTAMLEANLRHLKPGTNYQVRVDYMSASGESRSTNILEFSTPYTGTPAWPRSAVVTAAPTYVILNLPRGRHHGRQHQRQVELSQRSQSPSGSWSDWSIVSTSDAAQTTVSPLMPDRQYEFRMRIAKPGSRQPSAYSRVISVHTPSSGTLAWPASGCTRSSQATLSTVTLRSPGSSTSGTYTIAYREKGSGQSCVPAGQPWTMYPSRLSGHSNDEIIVGYLQPDTEYEILIMSEDRNDDLTPVCTAKTAARGSPLWPEYAVEESGTTSMSLMINLPEEDRQPAAMADHFVLWFRPQEPTGWWSEHWTEVFRRLPYASPAETTYRLNGLTPNTRYQLRLQPVVGGVAGPFSPVAVVQTLSYECSMNESYSRCASSCPLTCNALLSTARNAAQQCCYCVPGCQCQPGFVRSGNACIEISECPNLTPSNVFQALSNAVNLFSVAETRQQYSNHLSGSTCPALPDSNTANVS